MPFYLSEIDFQILTFFVCLHFFLAYLSSIFLNMNRFICDARIRIYSNHILIGTFSLNFPRNIQQSSIASVYWAEWFPIPTAAKATTRVTDNTRIWSAIVARPPVACVLVLCDHIRARQWLVVSYKRTQYVIFFFRHHTGFTTTCSHSKIQYQYYALIGRWKSSVYIRLYDG